MSISVSSPNNLNDTPFEAVDYFNAWRTQSQIPSLVIQKIDQIIDEYYHMKPEKTKRENEMRTLFKYNKKLVQTIQQFIGHQKKLIQRYNILCQLYITSFQKYCSSKSWDFNFNVKPIKSHFDKFSLKDWKFQTEQEQQLQPEYSYSSLLLKSVKQYFLNADNHLQKVLERVSNKHRLFANQQGLLQLQQLKMAITELNTTTITKDNMFDLLEKRKNIQYEIREIEQEFDYGFFKNDMNFIEEIRHIHAILFQVQPQKIKDYLKNQNHIRRRMKRRGKACRKELEQRIQRIQQENLDMKVEVEHQRKKREEAEKEKDKIKSLYDYLQLKSVGQNSRRDKNANNSMIVEENSRNHDLRATQNGSIVVRQTVIKKQQLRISELEAEISKLKTEAQEKQTTLKKLIQRGEVSEDQVVQSLRKRIISKLEECGIRHQKEGISVHSLLQKLLQRVSLHASVASHKSEQKSENIDIIMVESIALQGCSIKNLSLKRLFSQKQKECIQIPSSDRRQVKGTEIKSEKVRLAGPKSSRQLKASYQLKSSREMKSSKDLKASRQIVSENLIQIHQIERPEKLDDFTKIKRFKALEGAPSIELLTISQKKSMEQDSKNIFQHSKNPSEQKISDRISVFNRPQHQMREITKLISKTQQQNQKLRKQVLQLRGELNCLQMKLSQKQKLGLKSFISSLDLERKCTDTCQMQQIETVCQSIAKELVKLQGNQFSKMLQNVQTVIKTGYNPFKRESANIDEIPVLSKIMQDQNLFKSENIVVNPSENTKDYLFKNRLKASVATQRQRPLKLTLQSGEVKYLINMAKSIYFGNKDQMLFDTNKAAKLTHKNNIIPQLQSILLDEGLNHEEIRIHKEEDFIEIVANFQGTSRHTRGHKDNRENLSENSLKYSAEQREEELRSSLKAVNPKVLQDTQLLLKVERQIQQIKNDSQDGHELYWLYRKYKQAMDALDKAQAILRLHEKRKEACLKNLSLGDQGLSKNKLEENIYFLQLRVKDLQTQLQSCKDEYETSMAFEMTEIQKLKEIIMTEMMKKRLNDCK